MDISRLWEAEDDGVQYVKLFEWKSSDKNNARSIELIREARSTIDGGVDQWLEAIMTASLINGEHWESVLDNCNASLCHAEIGSENISIAYAYRSKYFFQFDAIPKMFN